MIQRDVRFGRPPARRGAALIISLVLLALLGAFSTTILKGMLLDRRVSKTELLKIQAETLLDDSLDRARLRREIDPAFTGETIVLASPALQDGGVFHGTTRFDSEKNLFVVDGVFRDRSGKDVYRAERTQAFAGK